MIKLNMNYSEASCRSSLVMWLSPPNLFPHRRRLIGSNITAWVTHLTHPLFFEDSLSLQHLVIFGQVPNKHGFFHGVCGLHRRVCEIRHVRALLLGDPLGGCQCHLENRSVWEREREEKTRNPCSLDTCHVLLILRFRTTIAQVIDKKWSSKRQLSCYMNRIRSIKVHWTVPFDVMIRSGTWVDCTP